MTVEAMGMLHMGELIQQQRIEKEMSQNDLAIRVNVELTRIQKLENGTLVLSFVKIVRITHVLDIDIRDLAAFYVQWRTILKLFHKMDKVSNG